MGDHFSAGLDLAEVGGKVAQVARRRWQGTTPSTRSARGRRLSRKPVVMAVQGSRSR